MPFAPLEKQLVKYEEQGLAKTEKGRWVLTARGFLLSNQIIGALQECQRRSTPLAKKR